MAFVGKRMCWIAANRKQLVCVLIALALAGCNQSDVAPDALSDEGATNRWLSPIKIIDGAGLQQFLHDQQGKVVLVDFWATWCQPCVEGYPKTCEIARKYSTDDVVVVAVAIDDLAQRTSIEDLLAEHEAEFTNFIAKDGGDLIGAMNDFGIVSGTLPTLRLYNRQGELVRTFGDGRPEPIRFEEIEVAIRALL